MSTLKVSGMAALVLFTSIFGFAALAAPAAAGHDATSEETATVTFSETEWGEIVVSNATSSANLSVTQEGEELPDIDLSDAENGTEVTFDFSAVDAEGFHIDNESGEPVTHDGSALSADMTGTSPDETLTVAWGDEIDGEADAYRFANATANDGDDAVGFFGSSLADKAAGAIEGVDQTSFAAGAGVIALIGVAGFAVLGLRD